MNTKELRLQIGKNARQCRKELGYTQEVLAEKCGFTAPYCSQIETGARLLSLPKFITLVEALIPRRPFWSMESRKMSE